MNDAAQYGDRSPASPSASHGDEETSATRTTAERNPSPRPMAPADAQLDSFAQLTGDLQWGNGQPAVAAAAADPGFAPPIAPPSHWPAAPPPSSPMSPPSESFASQQPRRPASAGAQAAADGERGYEDAKGGIHTLLRMVVETKASDLHLIAGTRPLLRVHGDLQDVAGWRILGPKDIESMMYKILPEAQRRRFQEDMELDCAYSVPGSARFRVNVYWQRGSIACAFRIIPYTISSVDELGLPSVVTDLARHRRGLVVVTGPTGAGKSTTLAAMVDIVNRERSAHILT